MSGEWVELSLEEAAPLHYGKALPEAARNPGNVPVFSSAGLTGSHTNAIIEGDAVIVGRKGNVGSIFYSERPSFPIDTTFYTHGSRSVAAKFLFYKLQTLGLQALGRDSAVPGLSRSEYNHLRTFFPGVAEQQAIAEVLGALDDKIAANTSVAGTLGNLAEALVASVKTEVVALGEVAEFHNRRRVPLSANERAERPGAVPYYGANGQMATVDEPIFNEPLTLMGEDGSVVREDGTPYVTYVWGPSWVNNHAHVLVGKGISTELLALALKSARVDTLVTGAVQPKLSMGNARRIELRLPVSSHVDELDAQVRAIYESLRASSEENRTLAATRDALLPQLMSGTLRVRDAEHLISQAGA